MSDATKLVTTLLKNNNIQVPANRMQLLNLFVQDENKPQCYQYHYKKSGSAHGKMETRKQDS